MEVVRVVGIQYHEYQRVKKEISKYATLKVRSASHDGERGLGVYYKRYLIGHISKKNRDMMEGVSEIFVLGKERNNIFCGVIFED